jgi:hypothetical protein
MCVVREPKHGTGPHSVPLCAVLASNFAWLCMPLLLLYFPQPILRICMLLCLFDWHTLADRYAATSIVLVAIYVWHFSACLVHVGRVDVCRLHQTHVSSLLHMSNACCSVLRMVAIAAIHAANSALHVLSWHLQAAFSVH